MEFVSFEIAKKLKEKGFSKLCFATYDKDGMLGYNYCQPTTIRAISFEECMSIHGSDDNCIDAPTISQVLKWLRHEKKIHIGVLYHNYYAVWIQPMKHNEAEHVIHDCKTHEEAELEGIEFAINNLI